MLGACSSSIFMSSNEWKDMRFHSSFVMLLPFHSIFIDAAFFYVCVGIYKVDRLALNAIHIHIIRSCIFIVRMLQRIWMMESYAEKRGYNWHVNGIFFAQFARHIEDTAYWRVLKWESKTQQMILPYSTPSAQWKYEKVTKLFI